MPEHQSDMVIGKRFGYNHVKHGIKYLCESGRELIELSAKQLVVPQCNSSSSRLSAMGNSNVSTEDKDRNKQKQLTHIRHRNPSNRHRINANANVLVSNCTEKMPSKKKHKAANGSNSHKIGDELFKERTPKKSNSKKRNSKIKAHHRAQSNLVTTTVKATTIIRTADNTETIVPANDDEFSVTSTTNLMASNEQSTSTSDEEY